MPGAPENELTRTNCRLLGWKLKDRHGLCLGSRLECRKICRSAYRPVASQPPREGFPRRHASIETSLSVRRRERGVIEQGQSTFRRIPHRKIRGRVLGGYGGKSGGGASAAATVCVGAKFRAVSFAGSGYRYKDDGSCRGAFEQRERPIRGSRLRDCQQEHGWFPSLA